jgi:Xaa-Pro aminopeptidase
MNSAVLHYSANSRLLKEGDILLIDAGAEYTGYGSDITRTYPVNGKWTNQQKIVYQIVLTAQKNVISLVQLL